MAYIRQNFADGKKLTAAELNHMEEGIENALPKKGGDMEGPINMNGQTLSGLNTPVGDTEAATKGYTLGLVKKAAPRNLLDNSDFTNPVNQRGFVSGATVGSGDHFIDRWRATGGSIIPTLDENGLTFLSNGIFQVFEQPDSFIGKTVTAACKFSDGETLICSGMVVENASGWVYICGQTSGDRKIYFGASGDNSWGIQINCGGGTVQWVALYKGEYTLDTLPEYQPKGYAAELLECQRYFLKLNNYVRYPSTRLYSGEIDFICPLPIQMRVTPTVSGQLDVYAGSVKQDGFTVIIAGVGGNALSFRAQKSGHGLTGADGLALNTTDATLSADL